VPAVIIAAAAAKPMTVLRIALAPMKWEKPSLTWRNTAVQIALLHAAIRAGTESRSEPWGTFARS
jgi:hypothetical protein